MSGQTLSLTKMKTFLSAYKSSAKDIRVNVKVAKNASHEQLVLVLDTLHSEGMEDFRIHTLK